MRGLLSAGVLGLLNAGATAAAAGTAADTTAPERGVRPPISLDLAGLWTVRLDPDDRGVAESWPSRPLEGQPIVLPGTLDDAGYGAPLDPATMSYHGVDPASLVAGFGQRPDQRLDEMGRLVRKVYYVGPAWYERTVEIPPDWSRKVESLRLERVLWESRLWLDGVLLGRRDSLVADHIFRIGSLSPGTHRLTFRIDNRPIYPTGMIQHGYGEETQIRWNGVLGKIELVATDPVTIESLRVTPADDRRVVQIETHVVNGLRKAASGTLWATIEEEETGRRVGRATRVIELSQILESVAEITVPLDEVPGGWDEFQPRLYRARVTIETAGRVAPDDPASRAEDLPPRGWASTLEQVFGFRTIRRDGADIRLDGRRLFLRGVLDCCVYPLEGHPPMDLGRWLAVMRTIKSYGFNHVRFHTWCPPAAAFDAADRVGLYLAPEAAYWPPGGANAAPQPGQDERVTGWLRREIRWMSDRYGNHPSFCFFCLGNEFAPGTRWDVVDELMAEAKSYDARRLYTGSTARTRVAADDYRVTHATENGPTRGIGPAHTDWDRRGARVDIPVISHETGQRPAFPDYENLLDRFTGPLRPCDLELYRQRALESGISPWIPAFARASALFALDQYKAEHEGLLRTPGWDGYHLLQLNDFTGQGEALVGLLDPFWTPKPGIDATAVRAWNGPVVPLARFKKYVYTAGETLHAELEVANFGPGKLEGPAAAWRLDLDGADAALAGGALSVSAPTGMVTRIGSLDVTFDEFREATGAHLTLQVGSAVNSWRFWIYPSAEELSLDAPDELVVTRRFDERARESLSNGGRVLLLAHGLLNEVTEATGYSSVYWSAKMFAWEGNNNLGVYPTPGHPALERFPHDGHSDWHWWELTRDATAFRLETMPEGLVPIIQAIPDFHDPRPLLHLFEARIGPGRLVVCGYDLESDLEQRPVARQLLASLLHYMRSGAFAPGWELSPAEARRMLTGWQIGPGQADWRVVACDSEETQGEDGRARNVLDGDPRTIWHTEWVERRPEHPHWITIDLGKAERLSGLRYLPRQDGPNGRIARYRVWLSTDGESWEKVVEGVWPDGRRPVSVDFPGPRTARYVKLEALSEVNGNPWSSAAEIAPVIAD